ncbi:multidrug transporter [Actinoplanes sp. SE50]|nr:Multidrug resistance protein mdtA [Actinoplanes sp. SE50/110]ATO81612.1 multidrug transporter [Actinoplanes sp. SE50]SLL99020.1 multidrug transporter [Actinoplanes sp. SE50/110]
MSKLLGQNRTKHRNRLIGAGIVVAGIVGGALLAVVHSHQQGGATSTIVAVRVGKGDVTLDVATSGTVRPATTRELSFAVNGTVASIAVRAGSKVKAGQTLAAVDATAATAAVTDARNTLTDAKSRLTDARDQAARVTAAATACATAASDRGLLATAASDRGFLATAASDRGFLAGADVSPTATVAVNSCTTRGYPDTGNDPVLTAQQAVNRAGEAVTRAEAALAGAVITAPIAGTVVSVAGSVGDTVSSGKTFVTLADTYTMQVEAAFPEADAGSLAVGQSATITLADHDDALTGTVVQVDPVGTSDGTLVRYGAVLSFSAPPSDLLVGQSAQVAVRVGETRNVLRVPSTAVHDISGGSGTVLLRVGGRSSERTVTVGLRGDQYTQVTDGLTADDQVVRSW